MAAISDDPALDYYWQALQAELAAEDAFGVADLERQRGITQIDLDRYLAALAREGEDARYDLNVAAANRGLGLGDTGRLRTLDDQRQREAQSEEQARYGAGRTIADAESRVAAQRADIARRRALGEADAQARMYERNARRQMERDYYGQRQTTTPAPSTPQARYEQEATQRAAAGVPQPTQDIYREKPYLQRAGRAY